MTDGTSVRLWAAVIVSPLVILVAMGFWDLLKLLFNPGVMLAFGVVIWLIYLTM